MPTPTQAWVVEKAGGPFELLNLTLDDPLDDEVLVQLVASGVCHTDTTMSKGLLPGAEFPIILGHEGSGRIIDAGSSVAEVVKGDQVLLSFASCTNCQACNEQHPYACDEWGKLNFGKVRINGSTEVGTLEDGRRVHGSFFGQSSFGRYALVKASSCVKIDKSLDLKLMAPLGCGLQTGSGAVLNVAKPTANSTLLISGMGGVGFGALFSAKNLGVKTIIAVDTVESRLALVRIEVKALHRIGSETSNQAEKAGATHTINAKTTDVLQQLASITQERGVDLAIEATGVASAAKVAFMSLGMRGVQVQVGDSGIGEFSVPLSAFLQGLRSIVGCVEGNCDPHELIPQLVEEYQAGKYPMQLICRQYKWEELPLALSDAHAGKVIKPIIVV